MFFGILNESTVDVRDVEKSARRLYCDIQDKISEVKEDEYKKKFKDILDKVEPMIGYHFKYSISEVERKKLKNKVKSCNDKFSNLCSEYSKYKTDLNKDKKSNYYTFI